MLRPSRTVDAYKGGAQVLWTCGPHLLQQSPPSGQGLVTKDDSVFHKASNQTNISGKQLFSLQKSPQT